MGDNRAQLELMRSMHKYIDEGQTHLFYSATNKKIRRCLNCGAPIDPNTNKCEYCKTYYI